MIEKKTAAPQADEGPLLTVAETASRLRLGRAKTYALIAAGTLAHYRFGKSVRIPESSLEAFKEKCLIGG